MVTDTPALGVVIPPAPPWYTARARVIWAGAIWAAEAWSVGTVATAGAKAGEVVMGGAGLSMNVVVEVVLALPSEPAADSEDMGMLTSVPVWPLVIDNGSWMRSGWPPAIKLPPLAVFSTSVPMGLCVVMPVARLEPAFEVVLISWRMEACETMALGEATWARPETGASMAGLAGGRQEKCFTEMLCSFTLVLVLKSQVKTRSRPRYPALLKD